MSNYAYRDIEHKSMGGGLNGVPTRKAKNILREKLDRQLFRHSLGVARMAYRLAERNGADKRIAYEAGLWHDYGKVYSEQELRQKASSLGVELDEVTKHSPQLLHAPVGAALLPHEVGIADENILQAIRLHTTGAPGMNLLDKIIYLADAVEPGRNYPGVRKKRHLVFEDLEAALYQVADSSLSLVLERGGLLHPDTVALRNELLIKYNK